MTSELILLISYWLAGPLTWAAYGYLIHNGRRKMLLMQRPAPPLYTGTTPAVTIMIPAKDEGARIRACLQSALAQDYGNFRVIAVNDRSVDDTGKIMDEMAAADPRLSVLHIQENTLLPGWTGKNNALFQGQRDADGEWLLFVDSDVLLQPDALRVAMSVVVNRSFDLLSLLPRLESHTAWESLLVPLAASAASTMYLVPLCNANYMKRTAFANGQFLLISRIAYEQMGTHEVVKDRYCEDIAIAVRMKRMGLRPRVSWGNDYASVRMYSSLDSIFKGWSRIYYSAKVGSPWAILGAICFILANCYTFFPALAWGVHRIANQGGHGLGWYWVGGALLHFVLIGYFLGVLYVWSGNPRRNGWAWPVSLAMLLGILFKALKMCVTKKVEWRGTTYGHTMAAQLKGGS